MIGRKAQDLVWFHSLLMEMFSKLRNHITAKSCLNLPGSISVVSLTSAETVLNKHNLTQSIEVDKRTS